MYDLGFRVQDLGFRAQGLEFRVQGAESRSSGGWRYMVPASDASLLSASPTVTAASPMSPPFK